MLCDKCLNKGICKYRSFLANAPMIVTIESCERYEGKPTIVHNNPNDNVTLLNFKEPIDYSKFNTKQEEEIVEEEEERVFVDLSEDHSNKVVSITDLLLGDDE